MILSVSRRTDIPAFYSEWFMNRIREKYVLVRNPMSYHAVSRVILAPEVIDCIVFWTKNPAPIIPYLTEIDKEYKYYFQFTLNGYDQDVEPNLPSLDERIDTFIKLSKQIGKECVIWRYDPILVSEKYDIEWHKNKFMYIAERLSKYTTSCVFSYLDMYDKISGNMRGINSMQINISDMRNIAQILKNEADKYGIILKTCSENVDLYDMGIEHSCCIDPKLISSLVGFNISCKKDTNQRQSCGCVESVDIGQYNTCRHGCKYCYANYSLQSVCNNTKKHNPNSPMLLGNIEDGDNVTERKMKSFIQTQMSLFD